MFLRSLALLDELIVDVWENTTRSDGDTTQELVQFFIVSDGQLNVSWDDSALLSLLGGVSGQFENLSDEVFEDGGQIDWSTRSDLLGISTVLQESANSTNWELKPSLGTLGSSTSLLCCLTATSLSFA
jgi:hypothetical protein